MSHPALISAHLSPVSLPLKIIKKHLRPSLQKHKRNSKQGEKYLQWIFRRYSITQWNSMPIIKTDKIYNAGNTTNIQIYVKIFKLTNNKKCQSK